MAILLDDPFFDIDKLIEQVEKNWEDSIRATVELSEKKTDHFIELSKYQYGVNGKILDLPDGGEDGDRRMQ